MTTIQISGRMFTTERIQGGWLLHGKRGALYRTMPFVNYPHRYFLINSRGTVDPLGTVVLSDRDGTLRQCQIPCDQVEVATTVDRVVP